MATYRWHEDGFIKDVAAHRGLRLRGNGGSGWTLEGGAGLSWDDDVVAGERGRRRRPSCGGAVTCGPGSDAVHQLVVARSQGGDSSFGDVEGGVVGLAAAGAILAIGGLFGRRRRQPEPVSAPSVPPSVLGPDWRVTDPSGVLDAGLAPLFSTWPVAWWGPGDERPARLGGVWLNQ